MHMQLGSCGGAAYIQAQTAFIPVRTGMLHCLLQSWHISSFVRLVNLSLLQTDGSEPNKLVIMNADVVKVLNSIVF